MTLAHRIRAAKTIVRKFLASTEANLTMITAIGAIPLMVSVGVGIDYARIATDTTKFQAAVDSALLAVVASDRASLTGLNENQKQARMTELNAYAQTYIQENYHSEDDIANTITASLTITDSQVNITASYTMPTSLIVLSGVTSTDVTVSSEVKKAARPVEIALVMDTTGSMGTTYMNEAKVAARNMTNVLYGGDKTTKTESQYIRIALVPFSGAVRLNKSAYDYNSSWIDTTGASSVSRLNFSDAT